MRGTAGFLQADEGGVTRLVQPRRWWEAQGLALRCKPMAGLLLWLSDLTLGDNLVSLWPGVVM